MVILKMTIRIFQFAFSNLFKILINILFLFAIYLWKNFKQK